tara:strand:+ start:114 stop:545 length:432 start_codon:yes stop_codon:yes gene_type:complete
MADIYCQSKQCCHKKTQGQIRGSKGNKHYQSNKVNKWLEYWCTTGCRDQWFKDNAITCMTAVGIIPKQTLPLENAWEFSCDYHHDDTDGSRHVYFLINKNMSAKHSITKEQAQTPEQLRQGYGWTHKPDSEAMPLAIKLGLAS